MTKAEKILENLPSVKIGLDDHYGKQTVLNALNQALSMSGVSGRVCFSSDCFYHDKTLNTCVGDYDKCTVKQTHR